MQRALMVENCAGATCADVDNCTGAKRIDVENCAGAKCVDGGQLCWCNVR